MLACLMLFMFVGIILAAPLFNVPLSGIFKMMSGGINSESINIFRYMQIVQGISLFIIPGFFLAYLFSGNVVTYLKFDRLPQGRLFFLAFLLMILIVPCINLMASLNNLIVFPESLRWLEAEFRSKEDAAQHLTELFLNVDNAGWMFFNILMIAVIPAIGEELIFRGILQKIFTQWSNNIHVGIILSSLLFSAMHLQFYGFFPRWILGAMFGYLLVWSGSIWLPVFAHFVNNTLAVVTSYLIHKGTLSEGVAEYGSELDTIPLTLIATVFCFALLWLIHRFRVKQANPSTGR